MSDPQSPPPEDQPVPAAADSETSDLPEEPDLAAARLEEFQRTLVELTPHVYVTPVLVGLNVLVFIAMLVSGVSLTEPTIADLLRWGADFGPRTTNGEWWRLFTCMFVHIGIIHILLNMWVLATAGPLVERMVGNVGFLLLYLVSGLTGSLASLFWNPLLVSAGASGAIFGIYGAFLSLLLRHRGSIPGEALVQLRNSGLGFLFYNLLYGMMKANVDNAAHIGGLVGGVLCGLVLSQPFTPETLPGRPMRNLLVSALGVVLLVGGILTAYSQHAGLAQVQNELDRFAEVEKQSLDAFNSAVEKAQRKELTDAAFANILERDVLPEWKAAGDRLSAITDVPAALQRHLRAILEYVRLRQEAWELFVRALREGNEKLAQQAMAKQQLAQAAAQRIANGGK